jgi:hypothetical protein
MPSNLRSWIPTPARLAGIAWASKIMFEAGGPPDLGIYFEGGIGDDIMCSAVSRELTKRGTKKIWQFTSFPEIFAGNPDMIAVPDDFRLHRLCGLFRVPCHNLGYPQNPPRHLIAMMCAKLGIEGEIELVPRVVLSEAERRSGRITTRPQIAIQSSSLAARYPSRNKLWPHEHFQTVANALTGEFDLVQLGDVSDPQLHGAIDLRGKTTVRQAAAILSTSRVFIGLVNGLMHLARAVECRSVIVYGGREHPSQSGYSANENLYWDGACAPCWKSNACDFARVCMSEIMPEQVTAAVRFQADKYGSILPVDRLRLPATQ